MNSPPPPNIHLHFWLFQGSEKYLNFTIKPRKTNKNIILAKNNFVPFDFLITMKKDISLTEVARRCSLKKLFLKNSQNSQKTHVGASF